MLGWRATLTTAGAIAVLIYPMYREDR